MALIPWRNKEKENDGGRSEGFGLATLRNEMDKLFESFMSDPWGALDWPFGNRPWPTVDVAETENEVAVRAEIPGVDSKDLNIALNGNQLVLSGEKKQSEERKGKDFYQSESRYGNFRRTITMPATVDPNKVEADYSNGVVTIRLTKVQASPPKRIEVKVK